MRRSLSQSPILRERHREDDEDRASLASVGSRAGSVMDLMFERLDALQSNIQSQVGSIQSQVGSLRTDVQSQVGSMQSQVGAFQMSLQSQVGSVQSQVSSLQLNLQSQVGEVMNRLERLEASPTQEFAVGQDSNPDCSVGAAVAAHSAAATFHSRHGLVNVDEDPGMLRRSSRLLNKPRVCYRESDNRWNWPQDMGRDLNSGRDAGLPPRDSPTTLQRSEPPLAIAKTVATSVDAGAGATIGTRSGVGSLPVGSLPVRSLPVGSLPVQEFPVPTRLRISRGVGDDEVDLETRNLG